MTKKEIAYDYTLGKENFRDVTWVNIKTGVRELIRLPLAKSMREVPVTPYHVPVELYNLWLQMKSCKIF